jgi:hypothetical protein
MGAAPSPSSSSGIAGIWSAHRTGGPKNVILNLGDCLDKLPPWYTGGIQVVHNEDSEDKKND